MAAARSLLVTGEGELRAEVGNVLVTKTGCDLECVDSAEYAAEWVHRFGVNLLMVHVTAAELVAETVALITECVSRKPPVAVIPILDGCSDWAELQLLEAGAVECMRRPMCTSRLSLLIDILTARTRIADDDAQGPPSVLPSSAEDTVQVPAEFAISDDIFFGSSPIMREIADQVKVVAPLDATVLISGETGTGKTRLSRLIHDISPRSSRRLLSVNCGALPPTLIESELFGHVKGAFTGAHAEKAGKFSEASDGTLLLDDVNCIPLEVQGTLLRAVEDRAYEPVGSSVSKPVQARIVVTCNVDLKREVEERRFRADLFYRLDVISFHLPPLRERREEIPPLVHRFLEEACDHHKLPLRHVSNDALERLTAYDWPGNVRELHNVVERAAIMCVRQRIDVESLPDAIRHSGPSTRPEARGEASEWRKSPLAQARWEAEKKALQCALERNHDNRTETASELGISRAALYKKLKKYGLGAS